MNGDMIVNYRLLCNGRSRLNPFCYVVVVDSSIESGDPEHFGSYLTLCIQN